MTKPFGKPVRESLGLPKTTRLGIAVLAAAIPAFFICNAVSTRYPMLSPSALFWPSVLAFAALYTVAAALWFGRRPKPRPPGEAGRFKRLLSRILLGLLVAAPLAFGSAFFYEPALTVLNGALSPGSGELRHAMVVKEDGLFALESPHWEHDFKWQVRYAKNVPGDLCVGSAARVTLRRGLLFALWVEKTEFEVLK